MCPVRSFAVIPAAGLSRRMGRPKLLLPWGDQTVIEAVLDAWQRSNVSHCVVVVRPGDAELARVCAGCSVDLVVPPEPPPEMKLSVSAGLAHIASRYRPQPGDVWLLAPADMPQLTPQRIDRVLSAHDPRDPAIIAPTFQGRRGHPVLFPWPLAKRVERLGAEEGVNALLDQAPTRALACDAWGELSDLDTPEDYRRLRSESGPEPFR